MGRTLGGLQGPLAGTQFSAHMLRNGHLSVGPGASFTPGLDSYWGTKEPLFPPIPALQELWEAKPVPRRAGIAEDWLQGTAN